MSVEKGEYKGWEETNGAGAEVGESGDDTVVVDGELEAGVEVLGEEGAGVDHCPGGAEVSNGHTDHCRTGQYPRPGDVSQPGEQ